MWNNKSLVTKLSLSSNKNDNNEKKKVTNFWNGIASLWDEIIEVSTYGPSERKMLKAQREKREMLKDIENNNEESFESQGDQEWLDAFTAAKDSNHEKEERLDFDGYALNDLVVSKWGVPLDIDFQRVGKTIYCTILPVIGYGSPLRSRHNNELEYLMHLQGVIEVLYKYDNLYDFISFIETTKKVPKQGTDSVPFRLNLNDKDIENIISQE